MEIAVGLAVLVPALPVHRDPFEAGFEQEIAHLGNGPESPLVVERIGQLGAVGKGEMDVAVHPVGNGVECRLFPDVGKSVAVVVDLAFLDDLLVAVVAPIGVEKENAVFLQRGPDSGEIGLERGALLDQPVAEVHRRHDVDFAGIGRQHIVSDQLDALALFALQLRQLVALAPVEHLGIQVDPEGRAL